METTLSLVAKDQPKKEKESQLQYLDRVRHEAFYKLRDKKKRTKKDDQELKELEPLLIGYYAVNSSQIPAAFSDADFKQAVDRFYDELVDKFGDDSPQKKMLILRLASAWNQAWSYERMFCAVKYGRTDEGGYNFPCNADRTRYLAEVRRGIESANDQIIRLTQALQNLVAPPIYVKAKNAIVAQNMQVNQGVSPKDLDVSFRPKNDA